MTSKPDLKRALQRSGLDMLGTQGRVRVLVALHESDDSALRRLTELGLVIDRVVGNTVLGSIEPSRVAALRQDPAVAAVDLSAPLTPKRD
jgi:hypothetical protein